MSAFLIQELVDRRCLQRITYFLIVLSLPSCTYSFYYYKKDELYMYTKYICKLHIIVIRFFLGNTTFYIL